MQTSAYRIIPSEKFRTLPRLNLGCRGHRISAYINVDPDPAAEPDEMYDVTKGLPYGAESVAEIQAHGLLDRIPREKLIAVMNELHRVLVPDGLCVLRVTNSLSRAHPERADADPSHVSRLNRAFFDFFTAGTDAFESKGRFYGILPWTVCRDLLLDGDATLELTLQPVKE